MHCGRKVFMALVLCTGVDPVLMKTRQLILQQAGHEVVTAMDEDAVKIACQQRIFDVAVIGQAASASKKRAIVALIRKHCASAKILELYRVSTGRTLEDADAWFEVPADVPQELAHHVATLAAKTRKQ